MITKKIMIPIVAVVIGGASFLGFSQAAQAQTNAPESSLVQAIAQKFNLDQSQVQSVFDQHKAERHKEMKQKAEDRLNQAVKDGKITEEQKTKILEKLAELKAQHDSEEFKKMTRAEKKAAMQKAHDELQTWATEQGIDTSYFMMGFGQHHGGRGK